MQLLRHYKKEDLNVLKKYLCYVDTLSYIYKPSFVHLWRDAEDIHIFEGKYGLYIYLKKKNLFLMPCAENFAEALAEMKEIARIENLTLRIKHIPDEFLHYFNDAEYILERDRDYDEYIYLQEKLILLTGKEFQAKRNHISQFVRKYPSYNARALQKDDKTQIVEMTQKWIQGMPEEFLPILNDELDTITKAFDAWEDFAFSGTVLTVDDKIVAYTLGEQCDTMITVHYEKADTDYHGAYTLINREYELEHAPRMLFANRMEDAGIEGLRKAKESYKPIRMVQKWSATLK